MFQSDHVCVDDSQIDELENRPRDHAGLSAMANLNQSQPDAVPGHLNDLSSLYDLVRSGDWLSAHKEWSFIFEDDGPVSELKLARNNDGLWQVAVTVPAINTSDDSSVLNALQRD